MHIPNDWTDDKMHINIMNSKLFECSDSNAKNPKTVWENDANGAKNRIKTGLKW